MKCSHGLLLVLVTPVDAGGGTGGNGTGGGMLDAHLNALPFSAKASPHHLMDIGVGVFFEHLYKVDSKAHTYDADFWLAYRWLDDRNYTTLFYDESGTLRHDVEIEKATCASAAGSGAAGGRRLSERLRRLASGASGGSGSGGSTSGAAFVEKHFVEFGSAPAIWMPDLHIRNLHGSSPKAHASLTRLYEDGTVERMVLVFAQLELHHPFYADYPFDQQKLTVMIESESHSTQQITITALPEFSGLEESLTEEWPGWVLADPSHATHYQVDLMAPDYSHQPGNEHRCEKRARYHLDIKVKRSVDKIISQTLLPHIFLIIVTWTAFYINVKVLMPRVAVGFISFLTLSNAAASFNAAVPQVAYLTWSSVFFAAHRLFIIVTLFETALCVYVTENFSTRVGLRLDFFARIVFPIDYFAMLGVLFSVGRADSTDHDAYDSQLALLSRIVFANAAVLLFSLFAKMCISLFSLKRRMKNHPMRVFENSVKLGKPLDQNELTLMFNALDVNRDGILSLDELVRPILNSLPQTKPEQLRSLVMQSLCAKPAIAQVTSMMITHEVFKQHGKLILTEIAICQLMLAKSKERGGPAAGAKQQAVITRPIEEEEEEEALGDPEEAPMSV